MTFEQAKYFCTIADERSINKAARLLNVSQPRLSHSMQTMEAELGFQIFYRSSMDSSLTPKGQELYQICRRMLQDYGLAKALSSGSRLRSLHLVAGSMQIFVEAFAEFVSHYQDTEILDFTINQKPVTEIRDLVFLGQYHMGVTVIKEGSEDQFFRELKNMNMRYSVLQDVSVILTLRRDHPLLLQESFDFSSLIQYPYVDYRQTLISSFYRGDAAGWIDSKRVILVDDRDVRHKIVSRTNAFGIGAKISQKTLDSYGLVALPLNFPKFRVVALWRNDMELSDEMHEYIQILKSLLDELNE